MEEALFFLFHSKSQIFDLVILVYFNAISVDLYAISALSAFLCVFSMFISGRMHIKDLLYTPRILMNCFNVFISVKEGFRGH